MAAVATAAIMSLLTHGSERLGGAASEGIAHSTETPPQFMSHDWDSGWVSIALAALYNDSTNLH